MQIVACASRNLGAARTTGRYLVFIDSDDVWFPEKLAEQVAILDEAAQVSLVAGALRYWHSWDKAATTADRVVLTGHLAGRLLVPPDGLLTLYPLGPAPGAGVDFLVRRSVWNDVVGLEERFRGMYEDQAFLSKVFLRHKVFVAGRAWINYRQPAGSATAAASWSSRHYHASRAAFLSWLSSYLRQNQIAEPAVAARLQDVPAPDQDALFCATVQEMAALYAIPSCIPLGTAPSPEGALIVRNLSIDIVKSLGIFQVVFYYSGP